MPRKASLFLPKSTEPFILSRTKLQDFQNCPCCFYLDRRLGISKPSLPAFSLNSAVDALLKKEFDLYRQSQTTHPIMTQYGIDAVPFQHPDIELWRNNFKGIRFHHTPSNMTLFGAVDDIWKEKVGSLFVVDYKATSTTATITLDTEYREGYKRQLEIYSWLFRQNGFPVSPRSYILYANGRKDRAGFNGKLEFDLQIIEHKGDDGWVGDALVKARECLLGELPEAGQGCEWCQYRAAKD